MKKLFLVLLILVPIDIAFAYECEFQEPNPDFKSLNNFNQNTTEFCESLTGTESTEFEINELLKISGSFVEDSNLLYGQLGDITNDIQEDKVTSLDISPILEKIDAIERQKVDMFELLEYLIKQFNSTNNNVQVEHLQHLSADIDGTSQTLIQEVENVTVLMNSKSDETKNQTDQTIVLGDSKNEIENITQEVEKLSAEFSPIKAELDNLTEKIIKNDGIHSSYTSGTEELKSASKISTVIGILIGAVLGLYFPYRRKKELEYLQTFSSKAKVTHPILVSIIITVAVALILIIYTLLTSSPSALTLSIKIFLLQLR